jgi:O-Antigen ligase
MIAGIASWVTFTLQGGVIALWCFTLAAIAVGLVLPLEYAVVSPLFMGAAGWLVDMLPLVTLAGWTAVVLRWAWSLWTEKRLPRGGRWIWLPVGIVVWTALGVTQIDIGLDFKHFLLLLGIQVIASGLVLLVVDSFEALDLRATIATGLVAFIVLMSVVVFAEWIGAPIQELQNDEVADRVEETYGVNAFPNNLGLMKYARSSKGGAKEFRALLDRFAKDHPDLPPFEVFLPKFQAYDTTNIVIRFDGSARAFEDELSDIGLGVDLIYDNIGLTPGNSVPRMRSIARNSLTYAGACVALFFFSIYLFWTGIGRRKWLGLAGIVSSLFGAGFSLSRGAWAAIPIGILYLLIDRSLPGRRKLAVLGTFVAGAIVLTLVFLIKYDVDPYNARAGSEGSTATRLITYDETLDAVSGIHFVLGFGTEKPRTSSGVSHVLGRYIPDAGTHSTYLNYLFRTGVPGALAIIVLYSLAVLHARAAAVMSGGNERTFRALAAAAMLAAAAEAVILSLYVEPIYTLIISVLVGLCMAGTLDLRASVWPWRTREKAS